MVRPSQINRIVWTSHRSNAYRLIVPTMLNCMRGIDDPIDLSFNAFANGTAIFIQEFSSDCSGSACEYKSEDRSGNLRLKIDLKEAPTANPVLFLCFAEYEDTLYITKDRKVFLHSTE